MQLKVVVAVGNNGEVHYAVKTSIDKSKYIHIGMKIGNYIRNRKDTNKLYNDMINTPEKYGIYIG